jgi:alkylhydroperoxidase/carboxymuconolactone decarboxylase family protein YurZ
MPANLINNPNRKTMGTDMIDSFREYREKMNEKLLAQDNKVIKRIFNLDTNAYMDGALSAKTKEMLGLVSSMVLRCDDCIKYHLDTCYEHKDGTGILGRVKKNRQLMIG